MAEIDVYLTIQAATEAQNANVAGFEVQPNGVGDVWAQIGYPCPDVLVLRSTGNVNAHTNPHFAYPGAASRYIDGSSFGTAPPSDVSALALKEGRWVVSELDIPRWDLSAEEITALAIRQLQRGDRSFNRTLGWGGSIAGSAAAGLTALGDIMGVIPDGVIIDRTTWAIMGSEAVLASGCLLAAWNGSRRLRAQAASLEHIPTIAFVREEPTEQRGKHAAKD